MTIASDVQSGVMRPEISIVVPCYNESAAIAGVIDRICAFAQTLEARASCEIIAVDDGSIDDTASVLEGSSVEYPNRVRVIRHPQNAGLVAAMRTGAQAARYGIVAFLDADLSYAPEIVGSLLDALTQSGAAVAVASPYMTGGRVGNVPLVRLIASRGANWLLSKTVGGRIRTFTGMVRAYRTSVFADLAPLAVRGEFNASMLAAVLRAGLGVVEVPAALIWPASRLREPSRISWKQLAARARLVLDTIAELSYSGKGWVKNPPNSSFVLIERPKGP